jgi:hypothetical protein
MANLKMKKLPESNTTTTTLSQDNLLTMATIVQLLRAVKARRIREATVQSTSFEGRPSAPNEER